MMKSFILLVLFSALAVFANAKIINGPQGIIHTVSGVQNSFTAGSSVYDEPSYYYVDRFKKGVITFGVDHHYGTTAGVIVGTTVINITVSEWLNAGSGGSPDNTENFVLEVSYDPSGSLSFQDKHIAEITGYEEYSLEITGITVNESSVTYLPANLYVTADLFVDRIFDLSNYVAGHPSGYPEASISNIAVDKDGDNLLDHLHVSWSSVLQAEEYQLEWLFINDYTESGGHKLQTDLAFNFKYNSTRVSTADNFYDIPLTYDKGYICFRVRVAGRNDLAARIFTDWSFIDAGTVDAINQKYQIGDDTHSDDLPFEVGKNWQSSITFAEEGKKKQVVSFYDGTLRNRQTVTTVTTDKHAVVGETLYDHLGRPAVQVLPTPVYPTETDETVIKYYPGQTLNPAGTDAYGPANFEIPGNGCDVAAEEMSTSSGASNYYSADNANQVAEQQFVPDANGYPFSQVQYTTDNTGRISHQGGVGADFQIGSGHESKYYYGHPTQVELDRLFGSEVGDYSHYQKNMVIDPNKQTSLSYLDQEGRVIATSLAGGSPENLEALPSNNAAGPTGAHLTAEMLTAGSEANRLSDDKRSLEFSETFLIPSDNTDVEITYTLDSEPFTDECIGTLCFDCVYDLTIAVIDECGSNLIDPSHTTAGVFSVNDNNEVQFQYLCDATHDTYPDPFTLTLGAGSYQLSKKLTVSQTAIDRYWESYSDPGQNTCWKTLEDFQDEYLDATDFTPCDGFTDCQACRDQLDQQNEIEHFTEDQYALMLQFCNRACESASYCATMMDALMSDVAPGGQYGVYQNGDGSFNSSADVLSVYNHDNQLPMRTRITGAIEDFWKHPRYDGGTLDDHYYDAQFNIAYVQVVPTYNVQDVATGYMPAVDPSAFSLVIDNGDGTFKVEPQYLSNVKDFIDEFSISWAMSLLFYHPEFSYYESCRQNTMHEGSQTLFTSESFDALMTSADDYATASTSGQNNLLPANTLSGLLSAYSTVSTSNAFDPFLSAHPDHLAEMTARLTNYVTIGTTTYSAMDMAYILADLDGIPPSSLSYTFGAVPAYRNEEWTTFRSIYYSVKQEVFMHFANEAAATGTVPGYNACIGDNSFETNAYDFLTPLALPNFFSAPFFQFYQPCSIFYYELYKDKTRRFNTAEQVMGQFDPQALAFEQTSQNGVCPAGNALCAFIGNMAGSGALLTTPLTLTNNAAYIGFYTALNNFVSSTPPTTTWAETNTATDLHLAITAGSPAVTQHIDLTQITGSTFSWSDVHTFLNLSVTGVSGATTSFTVQAQVINTGGTFFYTVNGTTDYVITGCSVPDQCELTDLGKDLKRLISTLNASGQLFSTTAIQVKDAGNTIGYSNLITDELQVAANGSVANDFWWKYDNSGQNFLLYHVSGTELSIHLNGTMYSGAVYFVNSIDFTNGQIILHLDGDLGGLNADADVTLEANSVSTSGLTPVELAECHPFVPTACQGTTFDNLPAMLAVLNESFGDDDLAHFNIMDNASMTDELAQQLPFYGSDSSSDATITTDENGLEVMTIDFTFRTEGDEIPIPYCPIVLTFEQSGHSWSDVTNIQSLHTSGDADAQGIYHELTGIVTFSDETTGTIFISSCVGFNECQTCESCVNTILTESQTIPLETGLPAQNLSALQACADRFYSLNTAITAYNNQSDFYGPYLPAISYEDAMYYAYLGVDCGQCVDDYESHLEFITEEKTYAGLFFTASDCFFELPIECRENYEAYFRASYSTAEHLESYYIFTYQDFLAAGLCDCVDDYLDFLDQSNANAEDLYEETGHDSYVVDLEHFCHPCTQYFCEQSILVIPDTPEVPFEDPCHAYLENLANANAQNAYNEYFNAQYEQFVNAYVSHCMSATESLKREYDEKEYHFTLYYYDQAGNLIRTIPPEGVELLDITSNSDALAVSVANDRLNNTHLVTTEHRLATTYVYNSLNQLVAQDMPDQDKMEDWSLVKPDGLYEGLVTTAIQMISPSVGYLTGYVDVDPGIAPMTTRGYLFQTTDGGNTWTRMNNLLGTRLNKIAMPSNTTFVAVGEGGTALISRGGGEWDMLNTYSADLKTEFYDVQAELNSSLLTARFVGLGTAVGIYTESTLGVGTMVKKTLTWASGYSGTINKVKSIEKLGSSYIYLINVTDGTDNYDISALETSNTSTTLVITPEKVKGNRINAIDYYSDTEGYAGGDNGNFLKLITSGTTFKQYMLPSAVNGSFSKLWFVNRSVGVAVIKGGTNSFLYKTTDAGATWSLLSTETSPISYADLIYRDGLNITIGYILTLGTTTYERQVNVTSTGSESAHWNGSGYTVKQPVVIGGNLTGGTNTVYTVHTNGVLTAFASPTTLFALTFGTGETPVKTIVKQFTTGTNPATYVAVLTSFGTLHQLFKPQGSSTWSKYTISNATHVTNMVLNESGTTAFILAYDGANSIYRIIVNGTTPSTSAAGVSDLTTVTPALSLVPGMAICSNQLTFSGDAGELYSSDAISSTSTHPGWTERSFLRFKMPLNDLFQFTNGSNTLQCVGDNGMILSRNSSTALWQVANFQSLYNFKASSFYSTNFQLAGTTGTNAFAGTYNFSTNTLSSYTLPSGLTGYTINAIATDVGTTPGQTYLIGDNGTQGIYIYASNPASTWTKVNTSVIYHSAYAIPLQVGSTRKAYAVGDDGRITRLSGTSPTEISDIYPPRLNDVHFDLSSTSQGTIVGDHFFIRNTKNAAVKWNYAISSASSGFDKQLTKVWTLRSQIAGYMPSAIVGGVSYFGEMNAQSVIADATGTPALGTITDLQFFSNGTVGYFTDGPRLRNMTYTYSAGVYHAGAASVAATASDNLNSFYRFDNGGVIVAGTNGIIGYRPPSGGTTFTNMAATTMSEDFKDICFTDYENGYVVGTSGALYHSISTVTNTSNVLQSTGWEHLDNIHDGIVDATSECAINTIAFIPGSSTDAVFGGYYTPIDFDDWYVRLFHFEKGLYSAKFYYDALGRIVVSQNARQYRARKYSYTRYDGLGRVFEAGEKTENDTDSDPDAPTFASIFTGSSSNVYEVDEYLLSAWLQAQQTDTRHEVTQSYYDETDVDVAIGVTTTYGFIFNNATQRKRIVHVTYEEDYDNNNATFDHATHYDYDIHGNVKTLIQDNKKMGAISDISANRFKRLDYDYDLISGNVHRVDYQTGMKDQWHHAYLYDADNRITDVFTTSSTPMADVEKTSHYSLENEAGLTPYWDKEASYNYYDHGPLARIELGEEQVQGLDYYYTLQGWVKGVNSNTLLGEADPGEDAIINTTCPDVYGFSLDYFAGDYQSISGDMEAFAQGTATVTGDNLYNGNIGRMITTITNPTTRDLLPQVNKYRYDQLNRLLESNSYAAIDPANGNWQSPGAAKYRNKFWYDANGNITGQQRWNGAGGLFDSLIYNYRLNSNNKILQNRLYHVNDSKNDVTANELVDQGSFSQSNVNITSNYQYDEEGRLIHDESEEIENITWRVDGKVKEIQRSEASGKNNLRFDYDAMGHRIAKHVYDDAWSLQKSTYYVLDAQGNAMGVYERAVDEEAEEVTFALKEQYIYGSSRLGVRNTDINLLSTTMPLPVSAYTAHDIGLKGFELTNHLGNVLSTISDKPTPETETVQLCNNDFSSAIDPLTSSPTIALSLSGNRLKADYDGTSWGGDILIVIPTVPGTTYTAKCTIDRNGGGALYFYARDVVTWANLTMISIGPLNDYLIQFTATGTSTTIAVETYMTPARTFYIDNFTLTKTDQLCNNDFNNTNSSNNTVSPFTGGSSTLTIDAGRMKVAATVHYANANTTLTTVPGRSYRVYFDIDLNASGNVAAFARDLSTGVNVGIKTATVNGSYYYDFTATNTSLYVAFENSFNGSRIFYVDNFRIEDLTVTGYLADIRTASDYYPFGASMRERSFTLSGADGFRFGFNNMEADDETKGEGNSYDFGARIYDPRLGRWLSTDALARKYPDWTPYKFALDDPLNWIDVDGNEEFPTYADYQAWAAKNKKPALSHDQMYTQGHWLQEDRESYQIGMAQSCGSNKTNPNFGTAIYYRMANYRNLMKNDASQYKNLQDREVFYAWADDYLGRLGHDAQWMGAAAKTVNTLSWGLTSIAQAVGDSDPFICMFIKVGNKMILDDMMSRIKDLATQSCPLGPKQSLMWDAQALAEEQNLIQPAYDLLPDDSKAILQDNFNDLLGAKGNVLDKADRWVYGMTSMGYKGVTRDMMPEPGKSWKEAGLTIDADKNVSKVK